MAVATKPYGTTKDGQEVTQITISNKNGMEIRCINYGCRITHLLVPGKNGVDDVVLGFDELAGYEEDGASQGAFIGRFGNRIANGRFVLNGETYTLPQTDGTNYLHGSLSKRVFTAEVIGDNSVSFTYTSPDGEDGFPGELWVGLIYTLTDTNELVMDYRARTTADTHVNLTNHTYFNLAGQQSTSVLDHTLWLGCTKITEVDEISIPTGRTPEVAGGAFDFTSEKRVGQDIGKDEDPLIKIGGGYDINYIIDKPRPGKLAMAAIVREPTSGRSMKVYTTQPGVQLYTGNFLSGAPGKGGRPMQRYGALCLETQHYPDSPNRPEFPTTVLEAGAKYHEVTAFSFEWEA